MKALIFAGGMMLAATAAQAQPAGYWPLEKSAPIIAKTQTVTLSPDVSHLTAGEQRAVAKLIEVGRIFQQLYELQRHPQAISSHAALVAQDKLAGSRPWSENLLTLYRLNQGPIATTLENAREPFLPVPMRPPGGNVWPWGITKAEVDAFIAANPAQADAILHPRTVVRRATAENLHADMDALSKHRALHTLHPGLRDRLITLMRRPDAKVLYAVPYSLAYADDLHDAHRLLNEAADAAEKDDEEFARYLRNRSRDLLTNDYESGDAAWITGRFKNLNGQIGGYETYDDELFGVKTYFSMNVLATRRQETEALRKALTGIQALENSLPYDAKKRVRDDIPVGVYDVVADFAQSRGGNTATILPNEAYLARRYGRTILLRANIMRNPDIFASAGGTWKAAVAAPFEAHLTSEANFQRTLWHEVGHYLGVDRTADGRDLDAALQDNANLLEEMKADLVSLYAAPMLRQQGYYTDEGVRAHYASGVARVLQNVKPRRDQPYQTMQLMQWNYFLDKGLLKFERGELSIDYARYHAVVGDLLREVLAIQHAGDKAASDRFIERWTRWDENLHGVVAKNIRDQQTVRFRVFKYGALRE
ncbi:MAG TPA: hypothetical protein VF699_10210 [Caulobacteraceae bacterium]